MPDTNTTEYDTSSIDTSLLSADDLQAAVSFGISGAMMGLPLDTLPPASEILTWEENAGHGQAWAEQYRAVAVHCYNAYREENPIDTDPGAQFFQVIGSLMASDLGLGEDDLDSDTSPIGA